MLPDIEPDAALDAAIAHHEAGRIDLAEAGYRAILENNPDEPDALNLLGLILQNQGHQAKAIELIGRALEIDPDFPEALTNLARAKRAAGEAEAAVALAGRAVALDPDLPEAQLQLGRALLDQARDQEALAPLQRAVALDPRLIDAHIALGNATMSQHDFAAAATAFSVAVVIEPDQLEALVNLGACLLKLDRAAEALSHQRHAADVAPENPVPHAAIASTLRQLGDLAGSIEACLRATALAPDYHDALILLGNNYISLGNFDQAEIIFRQALAVSEGSGSARAGLAAMGRGSAEDAEIERLSLTVNDSAMSDHERIAAGFALGSVLDREGRYDEAFRAFAAANDFLRAIRLKEGRRFDHKVARQHLAWAKITFTPELFAATRGLGNPSNRLVFILGMPRSGTTLVEQIVASHPHVFGAGELPSMPAMINALDGGVTHRSPLHWDRERIAALTGAHLIELAELNADAIRVTDKLPDNVQLLGQIAVLYPNARVILCRRDLRDVCVSCYFQFFGTGNDWSFDLGDNAFRARQIEELIRHWRKVLPLPILEVDYETLVGDLEGQSRRLIAFLGLDWNPACLNFHATERTVLTASHWQVRQPLYATSVGRWRHYRAHIGPLLQGLAGLVPDDDAINAPASAQVAMNHALTGAEVFTDLAAAHLAAKEPEAALRAARRAIALEPDGPTGHLLAGVSLMDLTQPEAALAPLNEAVRLAPEWFNARSNLASALSRSKAYAAAAEAWKQALALGPENVDCLTALAAVLIELGQLQEALDHLHKAATLRPNDGEIHSRIAATLLALQDAPAAEIAARRAVLLDPNQPGHLFGLAECLSALGQFDEAAVYFRRAAERAPDSARAQFGLTKIGVSMAPDTDIPRLQRILADPARHSSFRSDAGFALARALQSAGDYDAAFEACALANRLSAARSKELGYNFDIRRFRQEVDRLIATFTPARLASAAAAGSPSELPVFIVGMPRSGTTLVEQIAASHPRVFGRGETKVIAIATEELNAEATRHGRTSWLPSEVSGKAASLIEEMRAVGGAAIRVTDKMPDNIMFLGQIAMLLPKARIIFCRRDLRDVGVSCFFESFTDGLEWTFDLADIGARAYEIERLVVHWSNVLPLTLPMLEIGYEDLVADLEGQSRRLIQFLGLDWDPACLSFHTTQRQILTASHWQVRQPLYTSSVGRWRHYRKHLGPMIAALKGLVPEGD